MKSAYDRIEVGLVLLLGAAFVAPAFAQAPLVGDAAFGDWRADKPGVIRLIRPEDLPKPGATASAANASRVVAPAVLRNPASPRRIQDRIVRRGTERTAADAGGTQRRHLHRGNRRREEFGCCGQPMEAQNLLLDQIYASGLHQPFGIAFFPNGENPQWVYVADTDRVVRFPYGNGDLKAAAKARHRRRRFAAQLLRTFDQGHRLHAGQQADAGFGGIRQQ